MNLEQETLPAFDTDDRIAWRNFLGSRAGQRLFARAFAECPSLLGGGETNAILIRNGEVLGFSRAAQVLSSLSEEERQQPTEDSMYPSPEDDKKWGDGKQLEPPK